jgi:FkbM family methyltransferase
MNISIEDYEKYAPCATIDWECGPIRYSVPSKTVLWRVETLTTKEPDTIAWIETFDPSEIFVDIGANIGIYTIWAAMTRGLSVFSFEPESLNYAELNKNIFLNDLSRRVHAFCMALSDESGIGELHLSKFHIGTSCHAFGEQLDFKLEPFNSPMAQGCVSATLDELVAGGAVPMPNHIKIDVDGIEHKVVRGAANVLADSRVKSVLIELNTNLAIHRDVVGEMEAMGFALDRETRDQAVRKEGAFTGVGNHIFRRRDA